MNEKDELISAMAFKIGRDIEQFIFSNVENIQETNKMLQAKILDFRIRILKDNWMELPYRYNKDFLEEYDKYFGIKTMTNE